MDDPGLFEIMYSTRSMRRLKPDPVPVDLVHKVIEAGTQAASGQNTQPWRFLVVRDADAKRFVQAHYLSNMVERMGARRPADDDRSPPARSMRAAFHLAEHLHEAPVLLLVCGKRDWPFAVSPQDRVGLAPPSYGSVYPCLQNILLACRGLGLGLGATLTTLHQLFQPELHTRFGIPDDFGVVAMVPIGWPMGRFGPVTRKPVREVTFYDRWGEGEPVS